MGGIMASLISAASSMRVYERGLQVTQNNVTNASTPGFVKQRLQLRAKYFQPELGSSGGVEPGAIFSYRDRFSEQNVWRQQHLFGQAAQKQQSLSAIEPIFDISGGAGIATALSGLFDSFSQWAVSPNNTASRQVVIDRARMLARDFNQTSIALSGASENAGREIRALVDRINRLGEELRGMNLERRHNAQVRTDAGLDARIHDTLQKLAELVDFNALEQPDGTFTVLLGGQLPLLIGDRKFDISADFSSGQAAILDFEGKDVTGILQAGRLKGLLDLRNQLIPSYQHELGRLAAAVADRVNEVLAGGVDLDGSAPYYDLFTYDGQAPAATLAVTGIAPEQLAAALPEAPGGNGNALRLAALSASREIDGFPFAEFLGNLGARLGRDLAAAREDEYTFSQLLTQAHSLRADLSAVSLDEEAIQLIALQRAYQAAAQMVTVLNELTQSALNMIR